MSIAEAVRQYKGQRRVTISRSHTRGCASRKPRIASAGCVMGAAVVMMVALGNLTRVQLQRESGVVAL